MRNSELMERAEMAHNKRLVKSISVHIKKQCDAAIKKHCEEREKMA